MQENHSTLKYLGVCLMSNYRIKKRNAHKIKGSSLGQNRVIEKLL